MAGSVLGTSLSSLSTELSVAGSVLSTSLLSSLLYSCPSCPFSMTSSFATFSLLAVSYNKLKKKSIRLPFVICGDHGWFIGKLSAQGVPNKNSPKLLSCMKLYTKNFKEETKENWLKFCCLFKIVQV